MAGPTTGGQLVPSSALPPPTTPVLTVGQVVVDSVTDPGLVVRIRTEEVTDHRERQEAGQADMRVEVTEPMIATRNTEQPDGLTTEEAMVSSNRAGAATLGLVTEEPVGPPDQLVLPREPTDGNHAQEERAIGRELE